LAILLEKLDPRGYPQAPIQSRLTRPGSLPNGNSLSTIRLCCLLRARANAKPASIAERFVRTAGFQRPGHQAVIDHDVVRWLHPPNV
jgi:hypothetical protein